MNLLTALNPTRLKLGLIGLPLVLSAVYYTVFASDRYVSEAVITVRQANSDQSSVPGIALLLGGLNPPARDDTLYLRQYIGSLGLLNQLEPQLQLREHYITQARSDRFYRLSPDSSQEEFLDYYRARVQVGFDEVSSLLTLRVEGFDPKLAHELNVAILAQCETFINDFSQRMAREQMRFAEVELQRATQRLQDAKGKLLAFQSRNKLLDPSAVAQTVGALTAELQASLGRQEADLRAALSYLNEDSFQVRALRNQIDATRAQLEAERTRATSGKSGDQINSLVADFQELQLQAGFALDAYKLSLSAVENSRIEAARKIKSLVVVEPPTSPQQAIYPRRIYNLVTLLVVVLLLYGIARLVIATVREHLD